MRKRILFFIIFIFGFGSAYSQKVGLVLSGGGAKGAVHIGIIKALEDSNIPIDYIAGTSIGAIVGSLYAIGYSPEEILDLFLSKDFYYWQTGKVEENYQYYFRKNPNQPDFIRFMVPFRDSLSLKSAIIPMNLINPIQMNQAFMQLYSQANAHSNEDFNNLFVPFLCVASDVYHKKPIIFRDGKLEDAVRASMTFPLIFKPLYKDSVPLFDGGIYDNFPINPMKSAFHPDFIIGSSVAGAKKKRPEEMDMYDLMENMVMQQTVYDISPEDGLMMKFVLDDVGLLDFNKSKSLFDMGYKKTIEIIDSIRGRVERRVPSEEVTDRRINYKENLPTLVFRNIYITGINEAQKYYIESQIHRDEDNNFTIGDFKKTYFRLLSNSKIKEIFPSAVWDAENNVFDLYLDIRIKDEISIAFGGNVSSMSANQLYLGLGYQSLTEISASLNLDMQVGNTYNGVALLGKLEVPSSIPLDVTAQIVHNYRKYFESEKLFIDTEISTFIHQRETFGKIGVGFPFTNKAKMDIQLGYAKLEDKYYQNPKGTYYGSEFDRSVYNFFSAGVIFNKNTQNAKQYPSQGQNHHIYAQYISGVEKFHNVVEKKLQKTANHSWFQLDAFLYNLHPVSTKFNLGYILQGVASTKRLFSNYTASVLQAPAYTPTPHSMLAFNEAFRANQFAAGGIIPILKLNSTIHLRGDFHGFMPVFPIRRGENDTAYKGELLTRPAYMGEISIVTQLPFMSISLYANHYSSPKGNWNFGLNVGYLIFGPKFIP